MDLPCLPKDGDRVLVTLRDPVVVVLAGAPKRILAIEGELAINSDKYVMFRAMRLMSYGGSTAVFVTMRVDISVPHANIAGLYPAPREAKP